MEFKFRNVNDAFRGLVRAFHEGHADGSGESLTVRKPYSNPNGSGYRLMIEEPVLIHYDQPRERVLFNQARDANPFFHMMEALWMLAGRNDVAPLAYYNGKISGFSDDGKVFNGAYGYRWRQCTVFGEQMIGERTVDQLDLLVARLKTKPESSRAVLAMWNVEDDLLKIDSSKDVACNLNVVFSVREVGQYPNGDLMGMSRKFLDMTVTNRSNDLIWGTLGANYVHFTILQEYMAARLGVEVGRYCQMSTNLHVYDWNWRPEEWLRENIQDLYISIEQYNKLNPGLFNLVPLVKDSATFDEELPAFVEWWAGDDDKHPMPYGRVWSEPFLEHVAKPTFSCYRWHKLNPGFSTKRAVEEADKIRADDWRIAATNWLRKRVK